MRGTTESQAQAPGRRFFYGWVLVAVAAIDGAFFTGSAQFAVSFFARPMAQELGWSSSVIFAALTARGLISAFMAPIVGPLSDHPRWPRLLMPVGALFMGLGFALVRFVQEPWHFYLLYAGGGAIGMALGGGGVMDAVLAKWFIRKRPTALMWTNLGPGTGQLVFPLFLAAVIGAAGWRYGWMWLGVMTFAVLFPLSLLVRTRPEHMHTYPDGEPLGTPPSARAVRAGRTGYERSLTMREALSTPTFWFITLALGLGMFGFGGWQAHWVPYFRDNGLTNAQAARVILVYGVFTMTARFVWGFLSQRYRIRYVFAANAALIGVGVIGLLMVKSLPWVYLWAVPLGLSMGGFFQLQSLIMTDYFGREHIGAVRGMGRPIITPFSTASPLALALLRDWGGSYLWGFIMVALAWFCCSMLVLRAKPVQQAAAPGRVQSPSATA